MPKRKIKRIGASKFASPYAKRSARTARKLEKSRGTVGKRKKK